MASIYAIYLPKESKNVPLKNDLYILTDKDKYLLASICAIYLPKESKNVPLENDLYILTEQG